MQKDLDSWMNELNSIKIKINSIQLFFLLYYWLFNLGM